MKNEVEKQIYKGSSEDNSSLYGEENL